MNLNIENLKVIRSKRKSIGLEVTLEGEIVVRAPDFVTLRRINEFISEKEDWIRKHLATTRKAATKYPKLHYEVGDRVYYLGQRYTLREGKNNRTKLLFNDNNCIVNPEVKSTEDVLINFYKIKAKEHIESRVSCIANENNFVYKSIRITNAKSRWGSCGVNNSLNFSWRLIKAPRNVIDYVVIHELVHTEIKNHSKEFWRKVSCIEPDYRQHKEWLKENALIMLRD